MEWCGRYILQDRKPIPCRDFMRWAMWMEEDKNRIVQKTNARGVEISTIFLGLDHNIRDGPLVLFETMVFGGPYDNCMWRCCTWEEAEQQHKRVLCEVIGLSIVKTGNEG